MSAIKELKQKRAALVEDVDGIFATAKKEERAALADEEKVKLDAAEAEIAALDGKIQFEDQAEKASLRKKGLDTPDKPIVGGAAGVDGSTPVSEEHRMLAVQAWFLANSSRRDDLPLTERHLDACQRIGFRPTAGSDLVINLLPSSGVRLLQEGWQSASNSGRKPEGRLRAGNAFDGLRSALTTTHTVSGGAIMAPETMLSRLEINMLAFGGVRQVAEIIRTAGREPMGWPTADDTSNTGERIGESTAVTNADPAFAKKIWNLYKYSSKAIYVPFELLDGSAFDLAGVLGDMMGERIARRQNTDYTTGTGASQPNGIVTAATTFSAASATAISWADIGGLITAVDPAYRAGASFMFHDSIRNDIVNILDGDGHAMWLQGPNGTEPALLRGYPWSVNQAMASSATSGAKTILFGQLNKYKIREHTQIRVRRLTELAALSDQEIFVAFAEGDGNLLTAGTAPVKVLTH